MRELDKKDGEILDILSKEARIPLKTLAGRIGLSRSATGERVAMLEKTGIIRGYRADIGEINPAVVSAYILVTLVRTPSKDVIDAIAHYPEVRRVSSISGQLDLIVEVEAPSIDRLNDIRDAVGSHPRVGDVTTAIVLRREIERG